MTEPTSAPPGISDAQRDQLRQALLSPELILIAGVGYATTPGTGSACTISEINLVLTGTLTDHSHPCIDNVIRNWVIAVQDQMPSAVRNGRAWRDAAVGIAGSATADPRVTTARGTLIREWMRDALRDKAVLPAMDESLRPSWHEFLAALPTGNLRVIQDAAWRISGAARDVAILHGIRAGDVVHRVVHTLETPPHDRRSIIGAVSVVEAVTRLIDPYPGSGRPGGDFWTRHDPAVMLRKLIECDGTEPAQERA